jgi:hypothetical protein
MRFRRLPYVAALALISGCYDFFDALSRSDGGVGDAGVSCPNIAVKQWSLMMQGSSILLFQGTELITVARDGKVYSVSKSVLDTKLRTPPIGRLPFDIPSGFQPTAGASRGALVVIGSDDGRLIHNQNVATATVVPFSSTSTEPETVYALAMTSTSEAFAAYAIGQTRWKDNFYRAGSDLRFITIGTVDFRHIPAFTTPPPHTKSYGALVLAPGGHGAYALARDGECMSHKNGDQCVIQLPATSSAVDVIFAAADAQDEATGVSVHPELGLLVGTLYGDLIQVQPSSRTLASLRTIVPSDTLANQGRNVRAMFPLASSGVLVASDRNATAWFPDPTLGLCSDFTQFAPGPPAGSAPFLKTNAAFPGGWAAVGDADSDGDALFVFTLR